MERADTRLRAARRRRPRRRATRPAAVTGARQRYGAPVRLGRHSLRRLQERARPGKVLIPAKTCCQNVCETKKKNNLIM